MSRRDETLRPNAASTAQFWTRSEANVEILLEHWRWLSYIPRVRFFPPTTRFGARVGFSFYGDRYLADDICPKMRKPNVLEVTLTSPASRTHFTQTPYKTLILTRLLKETTVPLTVSVLPHQLAQTLLLKDRAVTAFPLHQNNGKGPVEWK